MDFYTKMCYAKKIHMIVRSKDIIREDFSRMFISAFFSVKLVIYMKKLNPNNWNMGEEVITNRNLPPYVEL